MAAGWGYSELSKLAKQAGGPEELVSKIGLCGFVEGYEEGKEDCLPWIIISSATAIGLAIYTAFPKLVRMIRIQRAKKDISEEGAAAGEILVDEINRYDATETESENPQKEEDNQSSEVES